MPLLSCSEYLTYQNSVAVELLHCRQDYNPGNHRPQLGPQHGRHHDEVRKNGISYEVGLMRSIAYRRIRLLNRKTTMLFKQPTNVGLSSN